MNGTPIRQLILFPLLTLLTSLLLLSTAGAGDERGVTDGAGLDQDYIVVSWNDLGMHCMNETHENFSILPPFNNVYAQIIRRGNETQAPQIVVDGYRIEYSIPGNTYSVGKTDFWDYDFDLFGVDLPPNIGLTGKGLTGELDPGDNRFVAEGIPLTPFTDAAPTVEDPYRGSLTIGVTPNPALGGRARFSIPQAAGSAGKILVFDAQGRTLALYKPKVLADGLRYMDWDGRGRGGRAVAPGVYFVRWKNEVASAAGRVVVR